MPGLFQEEQPGQAYMQSSRDPAADIYKDYYLQSLRQGVQAGVTIPRQLQAQETPEEVRRIRNMAKASLATGMDQLSDIGTKNGLTADSYMHLASLLGGNPAKGSKIFDTPDDPVYNGLMGEAQAAQMANEYQKQKATANLQYGVPEAMNMVGENIGDYNQTGIINAMAQPQTAALMNQMDINNKLAQYKAPQDYQMNLLDRGLPLNAQQLNMQGLDGQQVKTGVSGVNLQPGSIVEPLTPGQRETNSANTQQVLQNYSDFQAGNKPEVVAQRLSVVDDVLRQAKEGGSNFLNGNITLNKDQLPPGTHLADLAMQGKLQELAKGVGLDTTYANTLTALAQIRNTPGADVAGIDSIFNTLDKTGQINMKAVLPLLESSKSNYKQQLSIAPLITDLAQEASTQGGSRFNLRTKTDEALKKGYATPLPLEDGTTSQDADKTIDTMLNGVDIPKQFKARAGASTGYLADAIRSGISTPDGRAKMVDNLANLFGDRKAAIQFINDHSKKDLGGMQPNMGGIK